jgi:sulfur relay (sulfurtransferase) complex TusBCD TusD component (DsrE family)
MPMTRYLLIESRDPFDSNDVRFCCDLAQQLVAAKNEVTLFLVQNGVLPARVGARSDDLTRLAGAGVRVLAEASRCGSAVSTRGVLLPASRRGRSMS